MRGLVRDIQNNDLKLGKATHIFLKQVAEAKRNLVDLAPGDRKKVEDIIKKRTELAVKKCAAVAYLLDPG